MFSGNRIWGVMVPIALAGAMLAARVGADGGPAGPVILVADQANSTATIDAEGWADPIEIRVVTLSDEPVLSLPPDAFDPSDPVRIATSILHPATGELIDINIVEIGRGVELRNDGGREVVWVANDESPFTRASEMAYALEGLSVHRRAEVRLSADAPVVDWVSGAPIVEVFVWYEAGSRRTTRANYGLQIVDRESASRKGRGPAPSGGDPGGSPGPPAGPGSQGGGPACGGDPGGGPDLPPCAGHGRNGGR